VKLRERVEGGLGGGRGVDLAQIRGCPASRRAIGAGRCCTLLLHLSKPELWSTTFYKPLRDINHHQAGPLADRMKGQHIPCGEVISVCRWGGKPTCTHIGSVR
jgi:hypothetical protein